MREISPSPRDKDDAGKAANPYPLEWEDVSNNMDIVSYKVGTWLTHIQELHPHQSSLIFSAMSSFFGSAFELRYR